MRLSKRFFVFVFLFFAAAGVAQAAPNAPSNLSGYYYTVSGYGMVSLSWTDNADNETGFQLFRKLSTDTGWPSSYVTTYGPRTITAPSTFQSNDPNANLPAGIYDYKVCAYDLSGCSGFSNVYSVTVGSSSGGGGGGSGGSDTIAPSMPSGFNVTATVIGQNNLTWGASTDNVGVAGYKIYRCYGASDCSAPAYFATVGSGATSYNDTSVYSGMAYRYYVIAYDAAGNYSSPTAQILVMTAYDTAPPSAPGNLTASTPSGAQILLSWGASTDNVGVTQYAIYRNNSYLINTTSCCSHTDNSVISGGTYTYYVTAYDARGNISPQSNTVTVTAPSGTSPSGSGSDTTPPYWPSGYTYGTSVLSSTSIRINWSAASDPSTGSGPASGVAGYRIYRNSTQITTTTLLEYTDSGLAPSTAYNYSVAAYDAAGNVSTSPINFPLTTTWSDASNTASTSTAPTTDTTAPVITNVRAENIIGQGAQIKWNTDDLSNSRVLYGLSAGNLPYLTDSRCDGIGYVASHCVNLIDLTTGGTVYYYKVRSLNAVGLDSESAIYQFNSASSTLAADTTPPVPPSAVSSYAVSAFSTSISWSGAIDPTVSGQTASGVVGYKIYRNGAYISSATALSYTDSGLTPSMSYYYTIASVDGAGNVSNLSMSTNATTMANTNTTTSVSYASVSGKVTDSTGAPVMGANVYFNSTDRYYSAITDTAGQYALGSVYPASYSAKVYGPSGTTYQSVSKSISLAAGQATVSDFQFPASAKTIKGKVAYPDGQPVTNAGVGAYNNFSGAWTNAYTDAQGAYAIQVAGGKWQVNIYPKPAAGTTQTANWSYMDPPREVTFRDDAGAEEMILDFAVKGAPVSVRGYALLPDGSAPLSGIVNVSLRGSSGFEYRPSIDSSGMFSIYLPAGTYTGQIFSTDPRYGGADIAAFSAVSGAMDLGKFYLKAQSEKIKGTVKDAGGIPIAGVWINANQYTGGKFSQAKSGADGSFEISVSAGEWSVQAYADPMLGYSYNQPPKFIAVAVGGTAVADFIMIKSDAQISGSIADTNGQILSDASGYVSTYVPSSGMMMQPSYSYGGQIEKGSFNFKMPAGTYTLNVNFPPNSLYIPPSPQSVTVASGETKKISLAIVKTDVSLNGFLKDDTGNIIKGLGNDKIKVYLSTKGGAWLNLKIDAGTGAFSAQISAGTWYLGYWADPASGYISSGKDIEIVAASGENKKADIVLLRANSVISGTIKTADGALLPNVWVSANTRSFSAMSGQTGMASGSSYVGGASSDSSGKFEIRVPAGKYFLQSSYQMTSGYLNPPETEVTVEPGKTISIEVIFKKPDAVLNGIASIDGKGVPAYVWAWRESGGYVSARADDSGKYSFSISRNSKWRVAASYEKNGVYYKTADIIADMGDQATATQNLTLLSLASVPTAVERVVETIKPQSVELQNGAKVVLPANSLATSGSANVAIKPEVEVLSTGAASIVGTGYRVEAKDEKGQGITNLNTEITVSIPYEDSDLAAKGLKPEDLILSFFDETTQTWKPVGKQIVDKESKAVSATVSHLTLFALIAPADTTPPPTPDSIAISPASEGIRISWKNPAVDFHHIKIYRSSQKGVPGEVIFNYVTIESKMDSGGNSSHLYLVRAVDLAGNESANTAQYQAGMNSTPEETPKPDTAAPSTGQSGILLARVDGDPRVYAVENGKKRWIKSPEEFNSAGYKWGDIILVSETQMNNYPDQGEAFQFTGALKQGSRGEAVRQLQILLSGDKSVYPRGLVTGYYGVLTKEAVMRFQKKYKIGEQNGLVGEETLQELNKQMGL